MTTFLWSSLTNGQVINTFDPAVDVLRFDDPAVSAAELVVDYISGILNIFSGTIISVSGKTVVFGTSLLALTTTNVTFADGSKLLVGDDTTGTDNDDAANTLVGGAHDDQLIGLGGADNLVGGGGNDVFYMYGAAGMGAWGDDTIAGGSGRDSIVFSPIPLLEVPIPVDGYGINVNFNVGFTTADGIEGTITGGDGDPGSTIAVFGVERVEGTPWPDHFTASSLVPVNGLRGDVVQEFEGDAGDDTITGALSAGRITIASYRSAASGVVVNLGGGTATDGLGGVDTLSNVDGVRGSDFNDLLIGGGTSTTVGSHLREFFEGLGGNDTIDGGPYRDRVHYDNSPAAVVVNLSESYWELGTEPPPGMVIIDFIAPHTARDGWGGIDTLIAIEQVRGSAFNDTLIGGAGNEQFEGGAGNDIIEGNGGFDSVRYASATAAVSVNLATGAGQALGPDAGVGVDWLGYIESVRGSDFNDSLVGGGAGYAAFHHVEGFEGGAGNDTINGGDSDPASIDVASYSGSPAGVIVNLGGVTVLGVAPNTADDGYGVNGNAAGIDTLININGAQGSSFDDTLVGGGGDEWFIGRAGNDSIVGGAGADTVVYIDTEGSSSGVTVNLASGMAADNWGGTDTLIGIENVFGSDFNDRLTGDNNSNRLEGSGGRDRLAGNGGNDTLDGGAGVDTAVYSGNRAAYTISGTALDFTVLGPEGNDTLTSIERFQFSDRNLAFDLGSGEAAGNTVRIIGAAFDVDDIIPEYVGIGLDLFDSGLSMLTVCELVIGVMGNPTNQAFVSTVYQNLVGVAPSQAELDLYVGLLVGSGGPYTQAQLLELAANAGVNATNINLVGLQASGVEFV